MIVPLTKLVLETVIGAMPAAVPGGRKVKPGVVWIPGGVLLDPAQPARATHAAAHNVKIDREIIRHTSS